MYNLQGSFLFHIISVIYLTYIASTLLASSSIFYIDKKYCLEQYKSFHKNQEFDHHIAVAN